MRHDTKKMTLTNSALPRAALTFRKSAVIAVVALALVACEGGAAPPNVISTDIVLSYLPNTPDHPDMHWLDDRQVAVVADSGERCKRRDGHVEFLYRLAIFDVETKTKRWYGPLGIHGFCYADGQVSYPVLKNENGLCPEREVDLRMGPMGKEAAIERGSLKDVGVDPYTCKAREPLPDWAKALPPTSIQRLRPEHGFLEYERKGNRPSLKSIRFHKTGAASGDGIDISSVLGATPPDGIFGVSPQYANFKRAYFLPPSAKGLSAWWLYPDGKLEVAWVMNPLNPKLPRTAFHASVQTLRGRIAPAKSLHENSLGHSGLYHLDEESKPHKLVSGRIGDALAVSPNGCKLAFGNDTRQPDPRVPAKYFLQILDVCQEKAQ